MKKFTFQNPLKTGRIPTILGLILLFAVVGITIIASQSLGNLTQFFSQASTTSGATSEVLISNVTDSSVTVSWTTEKAAIGRAFVGTTEDNLATVYHDVRDSDGKVESYLTHYVRVNNLTPETPYFIKVGEATAEFGKSDGTPLTVVTYPALEPRTLDPIYGSVKGETEGLAGAIVLWESASAQSLSALTTNEGTYVIPVALARSDDGNNWFPFEANTKETLTISSGTATSIINCDRSSDRPVVEVTIGENKSCGATTSSTSSGGTTTNVGFSPPTGGAALSSDTTGTLELNIEQGQTVNNSQPTISGRAGPNETITITVHSDTQYSGTVKANPDGTWSWTPPGNLSPGEHTVTIKIAQTDGTVTTETRTFFVSGSEPILPITSGTPSATIRHLACINNACVQVDGEGSDECTNSNDCTPALPPPVEPPPPPPVVVPAETPTTGTFENTIIVLTLGLGLLTLGAGVFIQEKRN